MMRSRVWIGGFGFAALGGLLIAAAACSSDDGGSPTYGGSTGNPKGGATSNPGSGGTTSNPGSGGTTSNPGSGGATSNAGTTSTAGTTSASGGASGCVPGTGTDGPFCCTAPVTPTCNVIADFPAVADMPIFGTGTFTGGAGVYGTGVMRDTTVTTAFHIKGNVSTYSGFNIWLSSCTDMSAYTGVSFKISGTMMNAAGAVTGAIQFQPQFNTDYPWQPRPMDKKGACTDPGATADPNHAYSYCIAPTADLPALTATATPVTISWAMVTGGQPTPFSATASPKEMIGLQWQFPWSATATAYDVDITIDDITLTSAAGTTMACPPVTATGMGGGSGMGGGTGAGGSTAGNTGAGGSTAGNTGAGGSTAGNAGAGGSTAGAAGATAAGGATASGGAGSGGASGASSGGSAMGGQN